MADSAINIIKIQDTAGNDHKVGAETATRLQSSLSTSGTDNLYAVGTDGKSIVYFNNGIPVKSTVTLGSSSTPLYLESGVLTAATSIGDGQLSISANNDSHLTASGTFTANQSGNSSLTIGVSSGYAIPTSTQISNWDTAYSWGNHADAGYLDASDGIVISSAINDLYDTKQDKLTAGNNITISDIGVISANVPTVGDGSLCIKVSQSGSETNVIGFSANQNNNDAITFVAGSNITLTPDTANKTITVAANSGISGIGITLQSDDTIYPILLGNNINTDESNVTSIKKSVGLVVNPSKKSVAEGQGTTASGNYSHAEGCRVIDEPYEITIRPLTNDEITTIQSKVGNIVVRYICEDDAIEDGQTPVLYSDANCTTRVGKIKWSHYADDWLSGYSADFFALESGSISAGTYWARLEPGAIGESSHSEGYNTTASEDASHAEGYISTASGYASHAEGYTTIASGEGSHAEGNSTITTGDYAHSEGSNTIASGEKSHAEGGATTASGIYSHAEGYLTIASGEISHAEGIRTEASGFYSHTEGAGTIALNDSEHAEGRYNISISGVTQHTIGIGTGESARKNAHTITSEGKHYIPGIGGYIGTEDTSVLLNSKKDLATVIRDCENMESITWSALKTKRDNSQLVPGKQYRITDYNCTTIQSNTQSAGHVFDVIAVADSEDKLNENARAIQHSGDTYFASYNLKAWQLKYSIDNDTTRFAWADSTNGKGVIWYMKDEFENECYYDFKNIMFKPGAKTQPGTVSNVFYYTFSVATGANDATVTDHSLNGNCCYGNKIGMYISSNKQTLSSNVFRNPSTTSNCYRNTFGYNCYSNAFGSGCNSNTFGSGCYDNTFGSGCYYNTFGSGCNSNTFGSNCYSNAFGNYCNYNTFRGGCNSNAFGNYCSYNTFGNACSDDVFGNNCGYNIFESGCYRNTFGNGCSYNVFGNHCSYNTFGDSCQYIRFVNSSSTSTKRNYYSYIIVENGNQYINLDCRSTTSSSLYYQNVKIAQGVNNTTSYKTITDTNVGQTYQTVYQPANSQVISK